MKTIAKEEILRLNCPGFGQQSDLTIGNARALDTYKAIIVNPTSILHLFDEGSDTLRQIEAAQKEGQMEFSLPSDDLLSRLNDEAIVRTEEMVKFLEGGGLLIYFLCRPFKLLGASLNMDNYFWLLTLAPDKPAKTDSSTSADRNMSTAAQGRNIETTPDAEDSEFSHYFTQTGLEWSTVIRTDFLMEGYTALALAGNKKCIAAELFAGDNGGRVVFLPAPYSPDFDKTLMECATLWYNRKLGEEITMEDVKAGLGNSYSKGESTSERVQAAQVEAAKEELIAREKAVAEKLSKEMAATEKEVFAKSRQNMAAAKSEGGSSSASTGTATVAKGESPTQAPAKPTASVGSNGPSKSASPSSTTPPIQKTESGLMVPKLDKTIPPKSATTNSGTTAQTAPKTEFKEPEVYDKAEPLPTQPIAKEETVVKEAPVSKEQPAPSAHKEDNSTKRPGSLVAESLLKELEESANREAQPKAAEPEKPKAQEQPEKPKAELEEPAPEPEKLKPEPEQPKAEAEKPKVESEKPPEKLKAEPEKPKPELEKPKAPEPKAEVPPPAPTPVEKPAPAARPAETVTAQSKDPVTKFESKSQAPEWCLNYPFPGLDEFRVERGSLYEQIRQLQSKINSIDDKIADFDSIKNALLAGEGEDLINVCKKTLAKFGWSTKPAGNEEELWLCANDEPEAVVRIVRSPNEAKRSDLAQLDLACTKFWEENGREAKGILITSTWTKAGGPDEPDYPKPVAEFAEKHNLCLLTSAQLLSAFRELELGKGSGDDLRKKITSTNGPLKGFTL